MLLNGGFEIGGVGSKIAPLGWDISGTGGRFESATRASEGTGLYAINGWGSGKDGVISQSIATLAGQSYNLSFDISLFGGSGDNARLNVTASNDRRTDLTEAVSLGSGENRQATFRFTASGNDTKITFADGASSAENYDLDLDNVSLITGQANPNIPYTCQGISNLRGTHENVTWGSATSEERAWWTANNCTTAPETASYTCQGISNLRGTHENVTWGSATSEERAWWTANNCTTAPYTCQQISNTRGTHHNLTWGSATSEERAWWTANSCTTTPIVVVLPAE